MMDNKDLAQAFLGSLSVGLNFQVRAHRSLKDIADSGKMEDLPGQGFLIETLGVAADADFQWTVDVDFDKVVNDGPHFLPNGVIGADGRHDGHYVLTDQFLRLHGDAPQVGLPILLTEAQPFAQGGADDVAVQDGDGKTFLFESLAQQAGQGGFP